MAHQMAWRYGRYDCRVCLASKRPSFELTKGGQVNDGDLACDTLSGVAHVECCSTCANEAYDVATAGHFDTPHN